MIGTKIGQYRVLQLLGEGGMGRVLLAEHVLMKTRHAIKILHDQLSNNDTIVQRFINEARATGAIGHRNVIEITDIDQVEGGGPWYLVMKYLEGQTLTRFLESRKAPSSSGRSFTSPARRSTGSRRHTIGRSSTAI